MYYAAVVSFFVLALFSLVYDVGRVSETKMQMQNAADAAALEMAAWQARGMNVVQNINDEIYDVDTGVLGGYIVAAALSTAGSAIMTGTPDPFTKIVGFVCWGASASLAYGGKMLHLAAVDVCLKPLRLIYANGSVAIGYMGANDAAVTNGAACALGIPARDLARAYRLPVESTKKDLSAPLKLDDLLLEIIEKGFYPSKIGLLPNPFLSPMECVPGWNWGWSDPYYESLEDYRDQPMPRWIWVVVQKGRSFGPLSTYFLSGEGKVQEVPVVIACAAARAKGGNVIRNNFSNGGKYAYRPRGYGVGADAVLVPVAGEDDLEGKDQLSKMLSKIVLH